MLQKQIGFAKQSPLVLILLLKSNKFQWSIFRLDPLSHTTSSIFVCTQGKDSTFLVQDYVHHKRRHPWFFPPAHWEGGANLLRALFLPKKYNKNIDEVQLKGQNQEPKKLSLFGILGIYSIGNFLALKAGLVPMETTLPNLDEHITR